METSGAEDLFDSIVMADDRLHFDGYHEGYEEGTRQGVIEGRNHGMLHGAKLSAEVSFYYGFGLSWKCLLQNKYDVKSRKRLKAVESLVALIHKFPYEDPQYENLQEDMERVRAKFRQGCGVGGRDFRIHWVHSEVQLETGQVYGRVWQSCCFIIIQLLKQEAPQQWASNLQMHNLNALHYS